MSCQTVVISGFPLVGNEYAITLESLSLHFRETAAERIYYLFSLLGNRSNLLIHSHLDPLGWLNCFRTTLPEVFSWLSPQETKSGNSKNSVRINHRISFICEISFHRAEPKSIIPHFAILYNPPE